VKGKLIFLTVLTVGIVYFIAYRNVFLLEYFEKTPQNFNELTNPIISCLSKSVKKLRSNDFISGKGSQNIKIIQQRYWIKSYSNCQQYFKYAIRNYQKVKEGNNQKEAFMDGVLEASKAQVFSFVSIYYDPETKASLFPKPTDMYSLPDGQLMVYKKNKYVLEKNW